MHEQHEQALIITSRDYLCLLHLDRQGPDGRWVKIHGEEATQSIPAHVQAWQQWNRLVRLGLAERSVIERWAHYRTTLRGRMMVALGRDMVGLQIHESEQLPLPLPETREKEVA